MTRKAWGVLILVAGLVVAEEVELWHICPDNTWVAFGKGFLTY